MPTLCALRRRFKNYYEIIKNPVSLAEIEERANSGAYDTVDDLEVRTALVPRKESVEERTGRLYLWRFPCPK